MPSFANKGLNESDTVELNGAERHATIANPPQSNRARVGVRLRIARPLLIIFLIIALLIGLYVGYQQASEHVGRIRTMKIK